MTRTGPLRTVARSTRRDGCSIPAVWSQRRRAAIVSVLDDEFPGIHRPGGPDRLDYTAHAIVIGGVASGFGRRYRDEGVFLEGPPFQNGLESTTRLLYGGLLVAPLRRVSATIYPLNLQVEDELVRLAVLVPRARAVYSPMNTHLSVSSR